VFDKFKQLFGSPEQDPDETGARPRPGGKSNAVTARRPAKPRQPRTGRGGAGPALDAFGPPTGGPARSSAGGHGPSLTPREIPCPNCGESMLPGWGTTCGKCRPNLVAPKTLFMDVGAMSASALSRGTANMTLGWLVVVGTTDVNHQAALLELNHDDTILSRADAMPSTDERVVELADVFMSSGHAIITRPRTGTREDAFTIRDRDTPSPSANGTFVNSRRLNLAETVRLADGDMIQVGSTELLFRSLWLPALPARTS
jgi:hypothetical protein